MIQKDYCITWSLQDQLIRSTWQDKVDADLAGITLNQHMFNLWMNSIVQHYGSFSFLPEDKRVKLSWWKCAFWILLPSFVLGVDDSMKFINWKIGNCMNCDANPYDGVVYAFSYANSFYRGALIRCNKCGQFRWQPGEMGTDY